jgi:two-component system invasion response regulator UvrY
MVGVLVADDRPPFRRALRTILSATPEFELLGEAGSGEDAVALTRALCPDVVLMDVRMPGIGGIEATRRIKAVAGETVVVLVSSYPEQDLPGGARDCGAIAFVPKQGFGRQVLEELWSEYRATSSPPRGTTTRP